jgi:hypothetical protein
LAIKHFSASRAEQLDLWAEIKEPEKKEAAD